ESESDRIVRSLHVPPSRSSDELSVQFPALQRAVPQVGGERTAQQVAQLTAVLDELRRFLGQGQQSGAGQRTSLSRRSQLRPGFRQVGIARLRIDGMAVDIMLQQQAVAEMLQQALLEHPQHVGLVGSLRQQQQRLAVVVVKARVGILPPQQARQQL